MEQNTDSRNKPISIWSTYFQQKCQGNLMGKKIIFSDNGTRTIGQP